MTALSRGRVQLSSALVPSLTLRTTGAKSGLQRETALMCMPDGKDFVVVGSNFGDEIHPAWTANLLANPEALIRYRGRVSRVVAEIVGGEERESIWTALEDQWPDYRPTRSMPGGSSGSSGCGPPGERRRRRRTESRTCADEKLGE